MKKEYKTPVAEQVPLLTEQSLCQTSVEKYLIISGEFDPDSD
jgi:hypothetical protein